MWYACAMIVVLSMFVKVTESMFLLLLVTSPLEEEFTTPHALHVTKQQYVASREHMLAAKHHGFNVFSFSRI